MKYWFLILFSLLCFEQESFANKTPEQIQVEIETLKSEKQKLKENLNQLKLSESSSDKKDWETYRKSNPESLGKPVMGNPLTDLFSAIVKVTASIQHGSSQAGHDSYKKWLQDVQALQNQINDTDRKLANLDVQLKLAQGNGPVGDYPARFPAANAQ